MIAAIGLGFAFMIDKVSVSASSIALAEQGWRANFSSALHPDAIKKGDLYITDSEGEPVEIEMSLHENGKTIEVAHIPTGEYKLHIKESAVKGRFLKSLASNEIAFAVQEEISTLSNEDELEAYFAQLLELQKNNERYGVFSSEGAASTEESANSDAAGAGSEDHSTTNNQVEGVDEADLVKTDGSFIYSISESRVLITDVQNPDSMAAAEELPFEEETYPQQLFLSGDTLIVIGNQFAVLPIDGVMRDYQPHIGMT